MSPTQPAKKTRSRGEITEALVLACSRTSLADTMGVEALRTVVSLNYLDMVLGKGTLDLNKLWAQLERQEGFDEEPATDALCKFKDWEDALGLNVILPTALSGIKLDVRIKRAAEVDVNDRDLDKLLGTAAPLEKKAPADVDSFAGVAAVERSPLRKALPFVAGAAVLFTFGITGYFLKGHFGGPSFDTVSADSVTGEIPVTDFKKLGRSVHARLSDTSWLEVSTEVRTEQLRAALAKLEDQGIVSLIIMDGEGAVRATIQLAGGADTPQVAFY